MKRIRYAPLLVFAFILIAAGSPSCPAREWIARYESPGFGEEEAYSMAVDAAGNSYLVGTSDGKFVTIKYDPAGTQAWAQIYDPPRSIDDAAIAVAVDDAGNVYVTGGSNELDGSEAVTLKYNAGGAQQWLARYAPPGGSAAAGVDIVVDASGNAFVLVTTVDADADPENPLEGFDFAIVKYATTGQQAWAKAYNNPQGTGIGIELAVDRTGNVYVVGAAQTGSTSFDEEELEFPQLSMLTAKFSPQGTLLWQQRYAAPSSLAEDFVFNIGSGIAVDQTGNVHVTGTTFDGTVTIRYGPSGAQVWLARSQSGDFLSSSGTPDIAVDAAGNALVVTSAVDALVTHKYAPTGVELWSAVYDSGSFDPSPRGLAIDPAGNAYVTVEGAGGGAHTVKYAPDGKQTWVAKSDDVPVVPVGLGLDSRGNVIVGGSAGGFAPNAIVAIKYGQGSP